MSILLLARARTNHISAWTTMNPADKASNLALSGGNLTVTSTSASGGTARSIARITGKRYFEAVLTTISGGGGVIGAGIATDTASLSTWLGADAGGWGAWGPNDGIYHGGVKLGAFTAAQGDVLGFAVDTSAGRLWIRKNGTWIQGDPVAGTSPTYSGISGNLYAAASTLSSGDVITMRFNPASFGSAAPSGYSGVS